MRHSSHNASGGTVNSARKMKICHRVKVAPNFLTNASPNDSDNTVNTMTAMASAVRSPAVVGVVAGVAVAGTRGVAGTP